MQALDDADRVLPAAAHGELLTRSHTVQAAPRGEGRIEPRPVVQLARSTQIGLRVGFGVGKQVDVHPRVPGGQIVEVLGMVEMGVGQEHRLHLPALGQTGIEAAPQLGDVEEGLVVRP